MSKQINSGEVLAENYRKRKMVKKKKLIKR